MNHKVFPHRKQPSLLAIFAIHFVGFFVTYSVFKAIGFPFTWQSGIGVFMGLACLIAYRTLKLKLREKKS